MRAVGFLLVLLSALVVAAPIVWMISTSFKPSEEIFAAQPRLLPQNPTLENYRGLAERAQEFPIGRWFFNSLFVSAVFTTLALLVGSTAAYAFARLQFKGRDAVFMLVVATMMIPGQVTLIPSFLIVQQLGWFNTYPGLIVPGLAGAFGVFLLRQFMLSIPIEMEEAAYLDGAGPLTTFWRVILPLTRPALAALAIFTFMGSYNELVWPLIITDSLEMRTLPVGLMVFQGRYTREFGLTMAAAVISSLPVIVAFLLFQRRITEGIAMTGVKG